MQKVQEFMPKSFFGRLFSLLVLSLQFLILIIQIQPVTVQALWIHLTIKILLDATRSSKALQVMIQLGFCVGSEGFGV